MSKIYLDNASTTAIHPQVIVEMTKVLQEEYGNPSSSHSFGRSAKVVLETARKSIAKQLNCSGQELVFTSGGTEANNWILRNAVKNLAIVRIISSKIEHHAVLYPILELQKETGIEVCFLSIQPDGTIDYAELETLLADEKPTLVSLMHVNNETGVVLDLNRVGGMCKQYQAYFHSDTVQSIGKTVFNLAETPIDFLVASAHKFHGPKGVGFAFIRKNTRLGAMFLGGEQEKGLRAGTEAVHQIAGMAKALEICYEHLHVNRVTITNLKQETWNQLQNVFLEVKSNGAVETTFYSILNVQLPFSEDKSLMLLFELDMKGIAVSRGSACQSGSSKPSHVLAEMLSENDLKKPSIRISFSHLNTLGEVMQLMEVLKKMT
jgi:cysteine desulfurase